MRIDIDFSALNAKDSIVVANNRQVLAFKRTWAEQKGNSQLPQIFAWGQYIQQLYQDLNLQSELRLITDSESQYIFSKIIHNHGQMPNQNLLNEVIKNYHYLCSYQINLQEIQDSKIDSCVYFAKWVRDYRSFKKKYALIDQNDLLKELLKHDEEIKSPYIFGFKTLTPEQKLLFEKIGFYQMSVQTTKSTIKPKTFQSTEDELTGAISWARKINQQQPDAQIAIVHPNLSEYHNQVKLAFDLAFSDTLKDTQQKSYNISLGLSLTQYPLIQHLLKLLKVSTQLQKNRVNTQEFVDVLVSPFIASAQKESGARAELVNRLLSLSKTTLSLTLIKRYLSQCPALDQIISQIIASKYRHGKQLDSHLLAFNQQLMYWEFLSDRAVSSDEYQLYQKYQQSSLKLNQLSIYGDKFNTDDALKLLDKQLSQVVFQPQSGKANIHILGALEAEGLYFDHAWVMGATDRFLPAPLNLSHFIPHAIASQHNLANSTYTLVAQDSKKTIQAIERLAPEVICSYGVNHSNQVQQGSTLIAFNESIEPIKYVADETEWEVIADEKAPVLSCPDIHQGVGVLTDQMACGFKGFAHRLNIEFFDPEHEGFNKAEQGIIIHRTLERLYQKIKTQEQLKQYTQQSLNILVDQHLEEVINAYKKSIFSSIEFNRAKTIILNFLELEKLRDPFQVVAIEKKVNSEIAGLRFTTKLDRTDELENGEQIIFDYKTGLVPSNPWCGDAIRAPQLPIYAINNKAQGVAFVKLHADDIAYTGLSKQALKPIKQQTRSCGSWDDRLQIWEEQLEKTSLDFQQGKAEITPSIQACQYCEYDSLCRVEK